MESRTVKRFMSSGIARFGRIESHGSLLQCLYKVEQGRIACADPWGEVWLRDNSQPTCLEGCAEEQVLLRGLHLTNGSYWPRKTTATQDDVSPNLDPSRPVPPSEIFGHGFYGSCPKLFSKEHYSRKFKSLNQRYTCTVLDFLCAAYCHMLVRPIPSRPTHPIQQGKTTTTPTLDHPQPGASYSPTAHSPSRNTSLVTVSPAILPDTATITQFLFFKRDRRGRSHPRTTRHRRLIWSPSVRCQVRYPTVQYKGASDVVVWTSTSSGGCCWRPIRHRAIMHGEQVQNYRREDRELCCGKLRRRRRFFMLDGEPPVPFSTVFFH